MTNPKVNTDISMDLLLQQGTKTKKRRWINWILALLLVGGTAAGGWWYYTQQQQQSIAISYETTPVSRGNISVSITATGNLSPRNQVEIGTELSGTVNEVLVEANDVVTKGQKLASLNTDQLEDAITKARAALISARSKVTQAEAQVTQAVAKNRQSEASVQQAVASAQQSAATATQSVNNIKQAEFALRQANEGVQQANNGGAQINAGLQQANASYHQVAAGIKQATAQYDQARATTLELRVELNRLLELQKKSGGKLPAQQEIDAATASWKRAVASEASANASVESAKANLTSARAAVESAKANIGNGKSKVVTAKTDVEAARLAVETAKTNAAAAKANAAAAKANIDSVKASAESTKAEEVSARANLEAAKAAVMEAEANLRSAESNLAKAIIVSPIDGVVLIRSVEPGQTVASSLSAPTLFTLAEDLKRMELEVGVDEADVGKVAEGQQGKFTVDAWPGRQYPATISRVSLGSTLTDNVVSYLTVLEVANEDLSLRPGMTATATITTSSKEDVLLVPNTALRFSLPRPESADGAAGGASGGAPAGAAAPAESGGLLAKLMPPRRPPVNRNSNRSNRSGRSRDAAGGQRPQRVWVLENGEPKRIRVQTGISDGRMTEVTSDELKEGMAVITASSGGQAGAQ
ncbi:MAG: efflux RND transporter periplasmic adaptor subunit [Thiolinea sp.]